MSTWKRPSPALVISLLALFVALGGVAVADTGGNFILGQDNTADLQTKLTGTIANPVLRLENASSAGGARGIIGRVTSASAASGSTGVLGGTASTVAGSVGVTAQNTGGGSALSALVNNNSIAPLTVNSTGKVTNLNVDQLDGIDSLGFVQAIGNGSGTPRGRLTSGRQQLISPEAGPATIVAASGIANVNGDRGGTDFTACTLIFLNTSGSTYTFARQEFPSGGAAVFTTGTLSNSAMNSVGPSQIATHVRWQAWHAGDPSATARVITIEATMIPSTLTCNFAATVRAGGD